MTYRYMRHIPSPPLDAYIEYLYYFEGRPYLREMMLPMASPHVLFTDGDPITAFDAFRSKPCATLTEGFVIGTWSVCHIADWPPKSRSFGVCFKPGAAYPFLRLPLSELHNQFVPLDAIWGRGASELRERLHMAPTIQQGFDLLERLLCARLGEAPYGLEVVRDGVAEIARQHGALSIQALCDRFDLSHKRLLTQFQRLVGVAPKMLAGLYRLQHVHHVIDPMEPVHWALIARQCGYYDQSHLNMDFREHLGLRPTSYLWRRRRLRAENPEQDRLLRTLPAD